MSDTLVQPAARAGEPFSAWMPELDALRGREQRQLLCGVTQGKARGDVMALIDSRPSPVQKHLGRDAGKPGVGNRTAAAPAARRARPR